jgi:hypothetical protein
MDGKKLLAFLNGEITGIELQRHIEPEVVIWIDKLRERGRSASVQLTGHGHLTDMTAQRAILILDALIKNELPETSFSYVLEALLMSDRINWPNTEVLDSMEILSDPERSGYVDLTVAKAVRNRLSNP